jgi:hypothetical protein
MIDINNNNTRQTIVIFFFSFVCLGFFFFFFLFSSYNELNLTNVYLRSCQSLSTSVFIRYDIVSKNRTNHSMEFDVSISMLTIFIDLKMQSIDIVRVHLVQQMSANEHVSPVETIIIYMSLFSCSYSDVSAAYSIDFNCCRHKFDNN